MLIFRYNCRTYSGQKTVTLILVLQQRSTVLAAKKYNTDILHKFDNLKYKDSTFKNNIWRIHHKMLKRTWQHVFA